LRWSHGEGVRLKLVVHSLCRELVMQKRVAGHKGSGQRLIRAKPGNLNGGTDT